VRRAWCGGLSGARGAQMYEAKKDAAIKTIEKKQAKVEEIQRILAEDITPSLEKLRKERAQYMAWSAGNGERDRLERFCTAWNFAQADAVTKKSSEEMRTMQAERQALEDAGDQAERDIKDKEAEIKALQVAKDKEMGSEVKELEARATELSKVLVKATSAWQHRKENLAGDEKALGKLQKTLADLEKARAASEGKVSGAEEKVQAIQAETAHSTARLEELQRQRQGSRQRARGEAQRVARRACANGRCRAIRATGCGVGSITPLVTHGKRTGSSSSPSRLNHTCVL